MYQFASKGVVPKPINSLIEHLNCLCNSAKNPGHSSIIGIIV